MDDNTTNLSENKQFYSLNAKNLLNSASVIKSKSLSTIKMAYNLLSKNLLPNTNPLEAKTDKTDRKYSQLSTPNDDECLVGGPFSAALRVNYPSSSSVGHILKSSEVDQAALYSDVYQEMPVSSEDPKNADDYDYNKQKIIHNCDKSESFANETYSPKCLANALVPKDPFAPHSSLVRQIVELQKESEKFQILTKDEFITDMTVALNIDCKTDSNDLNLNKKKHSESDIVKISTQSNCDSSDESESSFKTATSDMDTIKHSSSKKYARSLFENKKLNEPQTSGIFSRCYNYFGAHEKRIPSKPVEKRKLDSLLECLLNPEKEIPEKESPPDIQKSTLKRKRDDPGNVLYSSDEDRPFKRRKYDHEPQSICRKSDFNHSETDIRKATGIQQPENVKNSFKMSNLSQKKTNNFVGDSFSKEQRTENIITEIPSAAELNLYPQFGFPFDSNLNQNLDNYHFNNKTEQQTLSFLSLSSTTKIAKNDTISNEIKSSTTFPDKSSQLNSLKRFLNDEISISRNFKSSLSLTTPEKNSLLKDDEESILSPICMPNAKECFGLQLKPEISNQDNKKDLNLELLGEFRDNCLENQKWSSPFHFDEKELQTTNHSISDQIESNERYSIFNDNGTALDQNINKEIISYNTHTGKKPEKAYSTNFSSDFNDEKIVKRNYDMFESTASNVCENRFTLEKLNGDKVKVETENEINIAIDENIKPYELSSHETHLEKIPRTSCSTNFNFNDKKVEERKVNDQFFEPTTLDVTGNGFSLEDSKDDRFKNSEIINHLGTANEINAVMYEGIKQYEVGSLSKGCSGNDEIQAIKQINQNDTKHLTNKMLRSKAKSVSDIRFISVPTASEFPASTNNNVSDYSKNKIQDVPKQNSKQSDLVSFVNEWMKSSIDTQVYKNIKNSLEINNHKQPKNEENNSKNVSKMKLNQNKKIRNIKRNKKSRILKTKKLSSNLKTKKLRSNVKTKTIRNNVEKLNMQNLSSNFLEYSDEVLPLILKRPLRKRAKPKVIKISSQKTTKKHILPSDTQKKKVNASSMNTPNSFDATYTQKSKNLSTVIDTIKSNSLIKRKHDDSFKRSHHKIPITSSLRKRNKPFLEKYVRDRKCFINAAESSERVKFPNYNKVTASNEQKAKKTTIVDDFSIPTTNSDIPNHEIVNEMDSIWKKTVLQDNFIAPFASSPTENFRLYRKSKEIAFTKLKQISFYKR